MDSKKLADRLDEAGWKAAALRQSVDGCLREDDGTLDPLALSTLARIAREREQAGHAADATRLAAIVLGALRAEDAVDVDDSDGTFHFMATLDWARWQLRNLLQQNAANLPKELPDQERSLVERARSPLDVAALLEVAHEPPVLSEQLTSALNGAEGERLADGLAALSGLARQLGERQLHAGVCVACRIGLDLEDNVRMPSDVGTEVVAELARPLRHMLVVALAALDDDDDTRAGTIKWLLKSKSGQVRIGQVGFPLSEMSERDTAEVVKRLQKSSAKSARTALLTVGETVLDADAYLALCREQVFPFGIVSTLIAQGHLDEAASEARAAIQENDTEWQLAKLFHERGQTDLAIDMLRQVAEDTVSTELELWLADRLVAQGATDEVLALYRNRFTKRPALPQYQALHKHTAPEHWQAMRADLVDELRRRRLYRPMVDIAANEHDVELLASVANEVDVDQAEHVTHVLHTWLDSSNTPRPVVEKLLAQLEARTAKTDTAPRGVVAAAPVPKRVRHKKFGEGDVVGWSGERDERKLEIEFESVGRKTLLGRFVEVIQ